MRRGATILAVSLATLATPAAHAVTMLVGEGSTWLYLDDGSFPGATWTDLGFDDSDWRSGPAQLGYGDSDEATLVRCTVAATCNSSATNKFITTYFRRSFTASGVSALVRADLRLLRDDGAVVYLNGTEIFRSNMPGGAISSSTAASVAIGGSDESVFHLASVDPDLLIEGENQLAVEIHQSSSTSSDISFDLSLTAATTFAAVTRGPYLQLATPDAISVRWRTDVATDSRVRFGTSSASLDLSSSSGSSTQEHELRITGLTADTRYYYSVGSSSETIAGDASYTFVTSPPAGTDKPTRVWVLGDSGTANADADAVRDAYEEFTGSRGQELWLMLGDNAYVDGTDLEFQAAVFDEYPEQLRSTPLWPTLGNHDGHSVDSALETGPYYSIFTLPRDGEAGGFASDTEAYYSFDYGNIHFVCLDSYDLSRAVAGDMLTWLEDDLAQTEADWTIAFWHHPPYSKGSHDSDADTEMVEMRANALPILESYGVDLVLTGHSHSYERSFLLDQHYGTSSTLSPSMVLDAGDGKPPGDGAYLKPTLGPAAHEGAVYVVAGSSGQVAAAPLNHPAMAVSLLELGSLVLDVNGNTLYARFLDSAGQTTDRFLIEKGTQLPAIFADGFDLDGECLWSSAEPTGGC